MSKLTIFKPHLKTFAAVVWFAFTFSLVGWWWIYFILKLNPDNTTVEQLKSSHRMFAWEGSILLAAILIGGVALIVFTYRDQQRHQRLRFFFSTFSHDIKTSISRLRLQAEVLDEEFSQTSPVLKRLIHDIQHLDLQLENSLLLANLEVSPLLVEEISLSKLISSLRNEFSELTVELEKEAFITGDKRALMSVFKNLLQNSVIHGKASSVKISIKQLSPKKLSLALHDNGLGYRGILEKLGADILTSSSSKSNGIGLLLTRRLLQKMKGDIWFESTENKGFISHIEVQGELR